MQCEQVENRLNALLDQRRHWARDRELFAHCAACESCRSIARAYAACEEHVELIPSLPADFATRVLTELQPNFLAAADRQASLQTAGRRRIPWQWCAVAAAVFVGVTIALRQPHAPVAATPIQGELAIVKTWPIHVEFERLLGEDRQLSEVVWKSTGREFAKLPHQVRRAAELSDSSHLTGAIRPVAAAWQSLRRVLPGESMEAEPANGETGFYLVDAEGQWV
jgi:hypothetical protein